MSEAQPQKAESGSVSITARLRSTVASTPPLSPCGPPPASERSRRTSAALISPLTLPEISRHAFAGCQNLNRIDIPPMVGEIRRGAFSGCINLIEVSLPAALRTIGANAFNSCNSLTELSLPAKVTTVGPGAFAFCKNLRSLTAPRSLRNIGRDATKGTMITKITRQ